MTKFEIVPMKKEDISIIAGFIHEAFGEKGLGEPWTYETSLKTVEESYNPEFSFVAKENNEVVGAIVCSPQYYEKGPELYVSIFVTKQEKRNQGIGGMLWNTAIENAKQKKLVGIRLLGHPKLGSFNWYKNKGLKESGWVELSMFF